MKREEAKGMIKMVLSIIIIVLLIIGGYHYIKNKNEDSKNEDIKSNMLLIQGAGSVLKENSIVKKDDNILIGTKLSEMDNEIVNEFKNKGIVEEKDYSNYFVLTNDDLKKMKLDVLNEENSYYLINYKENEVIITSGHNGKYKLSDIQ